MKKLLMSLMVAAAGGASVLARPELPPVVSPPGKPPAHFPGSQGRLAHVYAAKMREWEEKKRAHQAYLAYANTPPAAPAAAEPPASTRSPSPRSPSADRPLFPGADEPVAPLKVSDLAADIEKLEADTRAGLDELDNAVAGLEEDRKGFSSLDKTVAAAARVNDLLLKRCRIITATHATKVDAPLKKLKAALQAAPAGYRAIAADRRERAAAAGLLRAERDGYQAQAEMADAAATLCERRYEILFRATGKEGTSRTERAAMAVSAVGRLAKVHEGWAEVFASWPSTLQDERVAEALEKMSNLAEDLAGYTKGVRALTAAMAEKAAGGPAPQTKR